MDAYQAKILTMVGLGTLSIFAGLVPSWCVTENAIETSLFVSILLCAGSGVLLATAMTHMLPEVQEQLPNHPEVIVCLGFFLVYFIEEITCAIKKHSHTATQLAEINVIQYGSIPGCSSDRQPPHNPNFQTADNLLTRCGCEGDGTVCHITHEEKSSTSHISLLLALGVHAVLEGLAIGVQTNPSQILLLAIAVASHKFVVAFCLGVELTAVTNSTRFSVLSGIVVFALSSVVGIGLGMVALTSTALAKIDNIMPIMQALAVGTLLYVVFAEVMPRERQRFHKSGGRWTGLIQLFAVIAGFALMVTISEFISGEF